MLINGRTTAKLEGAVTRLREEFPNRSIEGFAADFSNLKQVESLLNSLGDVDILVNNVGIFDLKDFLGVRRCTMDEHIQCERNE